MFRQLLAATLLIPAAVQAAPQLTATPATLASVIASATDGATITVTGTHDIVTIAGRKFSPPLVLRGGSFAGLVLRDVDGVTLLETTITGSPAKNSYGISVVKSANIRIEKVQIGGAHRGIVFNTVTDFAVVKSRFDGLGSDGIDIALSHRGVIADNVMLNFNPTPPIYADGKLVKDGDHPDGIQMWSRPPGLPVSDITITGNNITGDVQCIFGGNHVRNGVDDGGFDRIVIEHNICRNRLGRGITLSNARASRIRFNDAAAIPGSRLLKTGQLIRTQVLLSSDDPGSVLCGNTVPDVPRSPATQPCR
ncbi:right-handed parallel beta-helix repeat-containing protein [Sphingosinicellaceae bacterium]|nr:right-handed parallel beta-helix repeat-containing protein [Sphingosinicellaceae bacterium]